MTATAEIKFEKTETGSWSVLIDGKSWGKVWKDSKGWRAMAGDVKLPGHFPTRDEAAREVKIETAPDRIWTR